MVSRVTVWMWDPSVNSDLLLMWICFLHYWGFSTGCTDLLFHYSAEPHLNRLYHQSRSKGRLAQAVLWLTSAHPWDSHSLPILVHLTQVYAAEERQVSKVSVCSTLSAFGAFDCNTLVWSSASPLLNVTHVKTSMSSDKTHLQTGSSAIMEMQIPTMLQCQVKLS